MDDDEVVDYDDLVCITCSDNLAPPIYYCGRIRAHIMCEKCIFQQIKCVYCGSIEWKRNFEAESHFDPHEVKQCFLCGFSGDSVAIVAHDSVCPFNQTIRCPLEDPYCPFSVGYTGKEIEHVIKEHVNPIMPLEETNNPEIVEDGAFDFSNEAKEEPEDIIDIEEYPDIDVDQNASAFPGNAPPHDIKDVSAYGDALRLSIVEDTTTFTMNCKDINFPGFFRHNVLMKYTKNDATVGFICSLQHYERCLGLDKFRVAVIFLGKYKSEGKYSFDVVFTCENFSKSARIRTLNVLENMHKQPPYDSVLEIKNEEFNPDYIYQNCQIEFTLIDNDSQIPSNLSFQPEKIMAFS